MASEKTSPATTLAEDDSSLVALLEVKIVELQHENDLLHEIVDQENLTNGIVEVLFDSIGTKDPLTFAKEVLLCSVKKPGSEEARQLYEKVDLRFVLVNSATSASWGISPEAMCGWTININMAEKLPPVVCTEWKRGAL
jgi:hypothetical protein